MQYPFLIDTAATESTFDSACLKIQKAIGQTAGDVAGLFSDLAEQWPDLTLTEKRESLAEYLECERTYSSLSQSEFNAAIHKRES